MAHGHCVEILAMAEKQLLPPRKAKVMPKAEEIRWLKRIRGSEHDNDEYDFGAEHEFAEICQHGDCLHVDCERQRPPEIDYAD